MERTPHITQWLIVASLIIGPLCLGSYYVPYRYPLLGICWISVLVALFHPVKSHLFRSDRALLIPSAIIISLCLWMTFNSEMIFHADTWLFEQRSDQPFPKLPGSADFGLSLDILLYMVPCLLTVLMSCQLTKEFSNFPTLVCRTIYLTGIFLAIIGIFQKVSNVDKIYGIVELNIYNQRLFFGTYRSPGIASCYLNIALATGLGFIIRRRDTHRSPIHFIMSLIGCSILITGNIIASSKAGIALCFILIILWCVFNRRSLKDFFTASTHALFKGKTMERNLTFITLGTLAISAGALFSGVAITRWAAAKASNFESLSSRLSAYSSQLDMLKDPNWLPLGYGPGSFMPYFPFFTEKGAPPSATETWVYAHNDYLQTTIEWGPIGFLCFFIIIGGAIYGTSKELLKKRKYISRDRIILLRGILLAVCITLLHALVDFPFQIESIAYTIAVLVGICWGHSSVSVKNN